MSLYVCMNDLGELLVMWFVIIMFGAFHSGWLLGSGFGLVMLSVVWM